MIAYPEWSTLGIFTVAALVLLLTPGPAVLYIVARSIDQGRRAVPGQSEPVLFLALKQGRAEAERHGELIGPVPQGFSRIDRWLMAGLHGADGLAP